MESKDISNEPCRKWRACAQHNGEDVSKYTVYAFDVPNDLYEKIEKTIGAHQSIEDADYYDDLYKLADNKLNDLDIFSDDDDDWDRPERDEYDDEDEYQEALSEYEEEKQAELEQWCLADLKIEDPGKRLEILDKYIGRKITDETGSNEEYDETLYCGCCEEMIISLRYSVDAEGRLLDFTATAEGLECEGIRSSEYGECFPDYDEIDEFFDDRADEYVDYNNGPGT